MENKDPKNSPLQEQENELLKRINKRSIIIACVGIVVIILAVLAVIYIPQIGENKAAEAIGLADTETNDSTRLELYMKAAEYNGKSAERAKLEAAIGLYKKGEYEKALSYLKDASISSKVIEPGQYALMGDCYVNLEKYNDALEAYEKGIKKADNNPQIVPFILVKMANIYRAQKQYDKEYETYEKIINDYPEYTSGLNFDIRKYAERAKAAAGK